MGLRFWLTFAASAEERESSLIWALRLDWEGVEDMVVFGLGKGFCLLCT